MRLSLMWSSREKGESPLYPSMRWLTSSCCLRGGRGRRGWLVRSPSWDGIDAGQISQTMARDDEGEGVAFVPTFIPPLTPRPHWTSTSRAIGHSESRVIPCGVSEEASLMPNPRPSGERSPFAAWVHCTILKLPHTHLTPESPSSGSREA